MRCPRNFSVRLVEDGPLARPAGRDAGPPFKGDHC
jgi:hypothetical protein